MTLNITYDGQTISVADGESITLKCKDLKARGNITVEAVADAVEPEMQTLTVINFNNTDETATFTMPSGYTFEQFVGSEYDTSGGAFTLEAVTSYNLIKYRGYTLNLNNSPIPSTFVASGTFQYAGESATLYALSGTWVFNEVLTRPSNTLVLRGIDGIFYGINSNSDTVIEELSLDHIYVYGNTSFSTIYLETVLASDYSYSVTEYDESDGWYATYYYYAPNTSPSTHSPIKYKIRDVPVLARTITFNSVQSVSKEFYEWFTANAQPHESITFYVDGVPYSCFRGTSWSAYTDINSDFDYINNGGSLTITKTDTSISQGFKLVINPSGTVVHAGATIVEDRQYSTSIPYRLSSDAYVVNNSATPPPFEFPILFNTNNIYCDSMSKYSGTNITYKNKDTQASFTVYTSDGWTDINYRFISVDEDVWVTEQIFDWFYSNVKTFEIPFGTYKFPDVIDLTIFKSLYSDDHVLDIYLPAKAIISNYTYAYKVAGFYYDTFRLFLENQNMYYLWAGGDIDPSYDYVNAYYNGHWDSAYGEQWRYVEVPITMQLSKNINGIYIGITDSARNVFLLLEQTSKVVTDNS